MCYFRDQTSTIPVAWRSDFVAESKEAESKMASLKKRIRQSEVKVTENYSCEWGGVEVHQGALQRQFFGRGKLLMAAGEMVEQAQIKGGLLVVEGGPGEGKTVFMAALADSLRTGVNSRKNFACDVISYSTAASQSARSVENLLRCLVQGLRKMKDTEEETPLPHSYRDLLSEFASNLSDMKKKKPLVLLVDGADLVQDDRGQLSSEWIPQQLPQGVCLVVSITTKAALLQTLAKKRGTVLFSLGQLTMPDRKEIVRKGLDSFGKKLSDSAFNNQLTEGLQYLPQSLGALVQYSLDRLCSQHRCMLGLRWALAALTVSPTGLRERDLYSLLNTCNDLSSQDGKVTWQEVLHLSRKPKGRVPMANFTLIVQSLQGLIGPSHCYDTDDLLALTNPEGSDSFLHCEAHSVLHLPACLIQSDQLEALHSLLSNYYFLYANVRHGLMHHLLETYSLYGEHASRYCMMNDCRSFLQRHGCLLSSWPALFVQQALNEPSYSSAHTWAQGLMGKGGARVVDELVSTFSSEPTCVVVSPDAELMVVGTGKGTLHFINTQTGQEVKSLVSSCDGISSCVFLLDGRLATTSFDGRIEIWDIGNGCRTALIEGHTNVITASDLTADRKHLATVSLDFMLKVAALPSSSPLNCVTFDPEGHLLAAGCWDGNVIMWNWLQNETLTLQLWSGGLGRSVAALKSDKCEQEPPLKKMKSACSQPAALCVAVNGDFAAVGYHGDGIKLFSLESGVERIWDSGSLDVSVLCLLWVVLDSEQTQPELLLSGGSDKRVRVWKRKLTEEGLLEGLEMLSNLTFDWSDFEPYEVLRGHIGGVTCLAFSPDGGQLLSGGKDQALMVWDVSSTPAVLSKSLPHSHKDWITGCVWTPDCVISTSNDGRLCLWDLQAGQCLREISWKNPLTSVCCLGRYVMAGCSEGALHVWNWETSTEICHIAAHKQQIHHCSLLPNTDKNKEINPEEMTVLTASDDGTVQLWKPLQVEHISTFQGHSGAICGVVPKEGHPEFLTVSKDCSLRCWKWTTESPPCQRGPVSAVCFSQSGDLIFAGYESGFLEVWQHNTVVGHKQTSESPIRAICFMPDGQFAVSYLKPAVDVWKLVWNQQHSTASLLKVTTHTVKDLVVRLHYCTILIGVSETGSIFDVTKSGSDSWQHTISRFENSVRFLGMIRNDEKSMWLVGEEDGGVQVGFFFAMGPQYTFYQSLGTVDLFTDEEEKKGCLITAGTLDKDLVVCGDIKGNMWFNQTSEGSSWSSRKPVGMFVCGGPVLHLELNPEKPTEMVCGDGQGKLYFLSWKE
ncbi:hypothetical protein F7725_011141 [Dissostichus mawsoni]|uniref:NACHT domain-containing protein n=1 Tax=Dissostichus mawsoni TaxID=36200 RepID=A0A7J5Z8K2_DISMA|nr:hypothetical protein F7725_011141 [Dissostichus mawsoni]